MRPSGYISSTFSTATVHPALTIPSCLRQHDAEFGLVAQWHRPTISLYRSSKICSGSRVRGKTTTFSGNSGISRDDMVPLWRFKQPHAHRRESGVDHWRFGRDRRRLRRGIRALRRETLADRAQRGRPGPRRRPRRPDHRGRPHRPAKRAAASWTAPSSASAPSTSSSTTPGSGSYAPTWRAPMDETRRMWELNFFALLGMIQLVVPHMRDAARAA